MQPNLDDLHGSCGIVALSLNDKLSRYVSSLSRDRYNAIGFYYDSEFRGCKHHFLCLFCIHNGRPVAWADSGYTLQQLLNNPAVERVTFYPVQAEAEDVFRAVILKYIGYESHNQGYTSLFYRAVNIINREITGYWLVNSILISMMDETMEESKDRDIHWNLLSCPFLLSAETIKTVGGMETTTEEKYTDSQANELLTAFVNLYQSNQQFSQQVDAAGDDLCKILQQCEACAIVDAHFALHISPQLREIYGASKVVDPLKDMRQWINNLISKLNSINPDAIIIDLPHLIHSFNRTAVTCQCASLSNLPGIDKYMSHAAMIVNNGHHVVEIARVGEQLLIPLQGAALTELSTEQLHSLCQYIDVLASAEFNNLQNAVVEELSHR